MRPAFDSLTAVATSSVEVAGTDHRALVTTIMVPKG